MIDVGDVERLAGPAGRVLEERERAHAIGGDRADAVGQPGRPAGP